MSESDRILASLEPIADQLTKKILDFIDSEWSAGKFPDRTSVLKHATELKGNENALIFFLKKHGTKHLLSFQITSQSGKFPWPILVTRKYIRSNGRAMLKSASDEVNRQKNATMPDQLKYDINISLERFLSKNTGI